MLSLHSSTRVFLHARPVDLRKGFDGLAALVADAFGQDPLSGHFFLFLNRRRDRVKILWWDRDGLAIFYKRLERGSYQLPRVAPDTVAVETTATELALILSGIDLDSARRRKRYARPAESPQ